MGSAIFHSGLMQIRPAAKNNPILWIKLLAILKQAALTLIYLFLSSSQFSTSSYFGFFSGLKQYSNRKIFSTLKPMPKEEVISISLAFTFSFSMFINRLVASIKSKTRRIQTIRTEVKAPSTSILDNPKVLGVFLVL